MIFKKINLLVSFIKTSYNYLLHKEVKPKYLFYGQLQKKREKDMLDAVNSQIDKFKSKKNNETFIFVEIGSYLGESLKLFGNRIGNELENFLLISIDPYSEFLDKNDKESEENLVNQTKTTYLMNKRISKIYNYFINNVSNYHFKHKHFHLRMTSDDAFKLLKSFNIKLDFCYVDGLHYYQNIKNDYLNYSTILKNESNYSGLICGDDYEFSFDQYNKYFDYSKEDFLAILNQNKTKDYIFLKTKAGINKKNKIGFHPGLTLFFNEIDGKIKRFDSGFWKKIS